MTKRFTMFLEKTWCSFKLIGIITFILVIHPHVCFLSINHSNLWLHLLYNTYAKYVLNFVSRSLH